MYLFCSFRDCRESFDVITANDNNEKIFIDRYLISEYRLTDSELPMKHRVQGDLILPQSIYSHCWERQQAAGDLGS